MHFVQWFAAAAVVLLAGVWEPGAAWSQAPKSCSDAYSACASNKQLLKECGDEKQWCMKTGTFADPKTKAATFNLQKK